MWSTDDGSHEMWIGALFADGAVSGGTGPDGLHVTYLGDGTRLSDRDEYRPDSDAVGWIGVCTCGWRSQEWTRVADRDAEDPAARRAFGDYLTDSGVVLFDQDHAEVEKDVYAAWRRHIEPAMVLTEIADLAAQRRSIDDQLAAAVARARKAKTPWEDIGRAAGITRQSAWERWRDVT